jgi:predicted CXXCH cytochrome family protein
MNRLNLLKVTLILVPLFITFDSQKVFSFTSAADYRSHSKGEAACTTSQCHAQLIKEEKSYQHNPAVTGACNECHRAENYPDRFGLEPDQSVSCTRCHRNIEQEIQTSEFVHGPIKNGDCISCHDPHASDQPFFLKQGYGDLCSTCHKTNKLFAGDVIHKPVKDGNCGLCHDPHASNYKARLTDIGANLCLACHEDMVLGITNEYVHTPILKSGCTECHDPHFGDNKLRLKTPKEQLCFSCHEDKKNEVNQYTHKHKPAVEGQCTSCHSPHYSQFQNLLLDRLDLLCFNCHKEQSEWMKRKFLHGPVVQGNCAACHNPHGADNPFILRLAFPHKFYTAYEKGKYDLCFFCHKEAIVRAEETVNVTNFRNGELNLHWFHVNQKKGRSCRACHDVHASDQEGRIRDEFPFGQMTIPMEYNKTETGGRCVPGCHRERFYDRVNRVENK